MSKMTIEERIKRSIVMRKKEFFFFTSDFLSFGSRSSVAAALRSLVKEEFLVRVSHGIYAKTSWNKYGNKRIAVATLGDIVPLAMERKGLKLKLGKLAQAYMDGKTTQVPNKDIFEIGNRKISRKFNLYGRTVYYEKNGKLVNKQ